MPTVSQIPHLTTRPIPARELLPSYFRDKTLFQPRNGWEPLEKFRQRATRLLKQHPFRSDVERLLMRYAEALDQPNFDVALLQMWSILEKVTDTIGANYDETIRRAIWLARERKLAKEKLEFIRMRRNLYVHSARSSGEGEQAAYLIKSIVDQHLAGLIFNRVGVKSLSEYGKFLTLPTNLDVLKVRRDEIERAIRIRT